MNINLYYKGQTISIKTDKKSNLKRVFEHSLSKFEQHFYQELLLFGTNLRLRLKRTNELLNLSYIVGLTLQDDDTIIVEPKENLTSSSSNIHTPKRYDLSNIDNNYFPPTVPTSDYFQIKNNINLKMKNSTNHIYKTDPGNHENRSRYQKSEPFHVLGVTSQKIVSPFNRNNTRRSLGADGALQNDVQDYSKKRMDDYSNNFESDSSISDFSNLTKPLPNKRPSQLPNFQTKSVVFENQRSISKSAPASPTKPIPPPRSPHTHMSLLNAHNVRTIGNKINISIVKKPNVGLGFTVVARDNQVLYGSATEMANSVVILVNKILPNGGAAEDNRLRPGDRLLEINGVSVTSLKDSTEKLRAISENMIVNLLISRVDQYEIPSMEHKLSSSIPQQQRKQMTFEIPINQVQKERQQLGLNILNLSEADNPSMGPGVYIYSILDNSLASHQGGLRVDDKLISINGRSLDNINVEETICQFKNAMQYDSILSITISRIITVEQQQHINETLKKEHNYFLLPNKMSLERNTRQSSDSQNTANISRYSSNDSLSYHNHNSHQPNPANSFVRDSNGRRSMSEKNKAHADPSQYTLYKETRLVATSISDDRLYSTLPSDSKLKKMTNNQSPYQPNKTQATIKPSQIKQLSAPKNHQDQAVNALKTPNRSMSQRNSPTRVNQEIIDRPQSPRSISQTPTHEQQPNFNRSMNNSFKKAVQKSLPAKGESYRTENCSEIINSNHTESAIIQHQSPSHNLFPIYNPHSTNDKIPRSNSVKISDDKNKGFNLKKFLTFAPNVTRTKSVHSREKSDTFPTKNPTQYNLSGGNTNPKHLYYSPIESAAEMQHFDDPVIIDSKKRVLEWQLKNDDVISKENKVKEQNIYNSITPYGIVSSKGNADPIVSARTSTTNRLTLSNNPQLCHETEAYWSNEATNQKVGKSKSTRSNNQYTSPRNGVDNRVPYQGANVRKMLPNDDIYATVNKDPKKEPMSQRQSSSLSQNHINKYRF